MDKVKTGNDELKNFIQETLKQIKEGSEGHYISDAVHFKVAIAKTVTAEGKVGVTVLGIGGEGKGEIKHENASEVGFSIRIRTGEQLGAVIRR